MTALNPTPPHQMVDGHGRPYFLWDVDMTLDAFERRLATDEAARPYLIAKLMRQAKPDDVFTFVSTREIRQLWTAIEPLLGDKRAFWRWLLDAWEAQGLA